MADLFTIFDYTWGAGFTMLSTIMWFSSLLTPVFIMACLIFWYSPSMIESSLMKLVKNFGSKIPEEVKWMGGTPHLFITLLLVMLMFNISGGLPYHYPLSSHFIITGSFAFVFWFGTVFLMMSPNWQLIFVSMVHEGGYLGPNAMVIFSEVISFLARPVTLMCRLSMNIIIGQIIMSLIGNVSTGVFFPFFWYDPYFVLGSDENGFNLVTWFLNLMIFGPGYYFLFLVRHSILFLLGAFMFLVELGVALLQACIFTGLLAFYTYEVPLKLQEDSGT